MEMRFENTRLRHLLKVDMLLNCRYDGAWLRRGRLYQPMPSVRASWSFAFSSAVSKPFVDLSAGLFASKFDDQADGVEVTAQRYRIIP